MDASKAFLFLLFLLSAGVAVVGSNILNRTVKKVYPNEIYYRFRPPGRLIKRIKSDNQRDKGLISNINQGLTFERIGLAGFALMFIYVLLIAVINN